MKLNFRFETVKNGEIRILGHEKVTAWKKAFSKIDAYSESLNAKSYVVSRITQKDDERFYKVTYEISND